MDEARKLELTAAIEALIPKADAVIRRISATGWGHPDTPSDAAAYVTKLGGRHRMLRVDMEGALAQLRPGRVAGNGAGAPSCADVSVEAFIEEVLALHGPYSEFVAGLDEYDDGDVGDRLGQVLTGLDWYLPHMVGLSLFEAGATFGPDCEVSIDYLIWAGSEEEAKERFDAIVAEEEEAYGPDLPLRVSYVRKAENVHRTWLNWLASGKGRNPVRA